MNPQSVSLDFTSNVASKSSAKPPVDSSKGGGDQFKKELNKQESSRRQEGAVQDKPDKKTTEPVSETDDRVSVAADDIQNGEELPELEMNTDSLIQPLQPELLIDAHVPEALEEIVETLEVMPGSVLDLPLESDFSVTMTDIGVSVVDGLASQAGLGESGSIVVPGIVPGAAPMNAVVNQENPLSSLNLEPESQPVEKLMTLNQIKVSLESSLETMEELDIDVDLDADNTIKEVMRFNDIQLKENQPSLKSYTTSVALPMSQATWGEQVSDKIVWLANQKIQFAEIHINPQELGPVDVKINVQNDQATVTFTSPHQSVRDLLEMNVNRLRDMMNENGVDLAHVDVSDQSSQHEAQEEGRSGQTGRDGDVVELEGAEATTLAIEQENLVDYYA